MISFNMEGIVGAEKLYDLDKCFRWDKISFLNSFCYAIERDDNSNLRSVLLLCLIYRNNNKEHEIKVRFSDVTNLNLRRIGGECNQLLGFEISDKINDGWEPERRFYVCDYENDVVSFSCSSFEVISVSL